MKLLKKSAWEVEGVAHVADNVCSECYPLKTIKVTGFEAIENNIFIFS